MTPPLALLGLGPSEIAILLVLFVLLFGATKIPELARSIGRAKGEFEKAKRNVEKEIAAGERETSDAKPVKLDKEEKPAEPKGVTA